MTATSKRQRARFYIYKNQKHCESFLYTKSQTLFKNPDSLRYIFIYKSKTLYVKKFHENFEVGIYIQKA